MYSHSLVLSWLVISYSYFPQEYEVVSPPIKSRQTNPHHPALIRQLTPGIFLSFSHTALVLAILCSVPPVLSMTISVHSPSWCKHCTFSWRTFLTLFTSSTQPDKQISISKHHSHTLHVCVSPCVWTSDQFFCDSIAWIATLSIYWTFHMITTSIDVYRDYLSTQ